MPNGRLITIVCEINQPEADWIWKQHINSEVATHGIQTVSAISNGDIIKDRDKLEKTLCNIAEILDGRSLDSDKLDKIKDLIGFDK